MWRQGIPAAFIYSLSQRVLPYLYLCIEIKGYEHSGY